MYMYIHIYMHMYIYLYVYINTDKKNRIYIYRRMWRAWRFFFIDAFVLFIACNGSVLVIAA